MLADLIDGDIDRPIIGGQLHNIPRELLGHRQRGHRHQSPRHHRLLATLLFALSCISCHRTMVDKDANEHLLQDLAGSLAQKAVVDEGRCVADVWG